MGTVIFEALTPEAIEDIKADNLTREVQLALKIISEEKEQSSKFSTSDLLKLVSYLVTVFKSNIKISDKKSEREIFDLVNCLLALLNWKKCHDIASRFSGLLTLQSTVHLFRICARNIHLFLPCHCCAVAEQHF